ncbi:hypothetical protein SRHO_G00108700 [Serrasalmus rhombeus]
MHTLCDIQEGCCRETPSNRCPSMLCSPHPRSMSEITAPLHCSNLTNDIMCRIKHRPSDEKKHVCHCPHRNGEEMPDSLLHHIVP